MYVRTYRLYIIIYVICIFPFHLFFLWKFFIILSYGTANPDSEFTLSLSHSISILFLLWFLLVFGSGSGSFIYTLKSVVCWLAVSRCRYLRCLPVYSNYFDVVGKFSKLFVIFLDDVPFPCELFGCVRVFSDFIQIGLRDVNKGHVRCCQCFPIHHSQSSHPSKYWWIYYVFVRPCMQHDLNFRFRDEIHFDCTTVNNL